MTTYVLSPLAKFSRLDNDGRAVLHAGQGDARVHLALDGCGAQPLIGWLLSCHTEADVNALAGSVAGAAGLSDDDAHELVRDLIESSVLIPADEQATTRAHLRRWGEFGWRDAADFHLATYGLRFVPDEVDGVTYADYFASMLTETVTAGIQPPAFAPRSATRLPIPTNVPPPMTVDEVLSHAQPINRFDGPALRGSELVAPLRLAVGSQRTVGGMLGEHQFRSYPSGGARHPFEVYLVSKGIADIPAGVYQFDPIAGDLVTVPEHGDPHHIDAACFGKGGILTAGVVLVLTCRWLRHSWKYRYARSYRMVLLEAGHIAQAINLAMLRHGIGVYHCPSISDDEVLQILALDDDCAEGPIHALGLGHGGTR
jgi:SagB-type dehydrogenase family enzyme